MPPATFIKRTGGIGVRSHPIVFDKKEKDMVNMKTQGSGDANLYIENFYVAQLNLKKLIEEERLKKRLNRRMRRQGVA